MQNDPFFNSVFSRMVSGDTAGQVLPMDAYRRGSNVWVHIDMPGIAPDSLDVNVERSVLTISGERRWSRSEGDHVYTSERAQGAFRRQVHLGEGLDAQNIEADYDHGVLTLRIPVAEAAKPRKIAVQVNAGGPAIDADTSDVVDQAAETETVAG
ncbi:MAG: Hsp20/alpha crystallin family protein [Acidimicrobiales bacterium]